MSNNKQSSIEKLISQLKISTYWNNLISELELMECGEIDIIEQAKAMHKYEIEQAFYEGNHNSIDYWNAYSEIKEYEQYYNETYGGNK